MKKLNRTEWLLVAIIVLNVIGITIKLVQYFGG
jgi:Sec-independent protein translocase protein TatA|nr:MAG TPA: hypothetical protein [Caudoviricetes sp.]DAV29926.1 MAG TPA: hypothetical protein [Caudoviricetes sp.]